jgi:glycosyltransferase involved in cell wall biosynthesis
MGESQQYPTVNIIFPRQTQQFVESLNGESRQYPSISVVIPALNEARNLRHVLPLIPWFVHEIILVDGYSTDDTIHLVEHLRPAIRPPIHIIMQAGKGKGDALRVGCAASTGDIIVTLDADGSADPREIPFFVEALLRGNDFAKGSRCILGGSSHDFSILRRLGNYGLRKLVNLLFQTRFSDLCYGYNAFWRHCLDYIIIDCDGFEVETLIHLRVHKANLRIVEVPSIEFRRIFGKSNLHAFRDGWCVLRTILRERSKDASSLPRPYHPMNPYIITDPSSVPKDIVL